MGRRIGRSLSSFTLLLTFVFIVSGQDLVNDIICPVPGNPDPASVTEDQCNTYTACEYTDGTCHMKRNNESGYIVTSLPVDTGRGFQQTLQKANNLNTLFGADIEELTLEVIYHEDYHVQIKIYDPANDRYEVPIERTLPDTPGTDPLYSVTTPTTVGEPLTIIVERTSTGTDVFRLAGPLTFEDQFIQITNRLSSGYLYGIGEHNRMSLKHSFDSRNNYPLFARDQPTDPFSNVNHYGSFPYYVNIEDDDGNTHSVFFENSNAMEFSTFSLGEYPSVTTRTIGGILDIHLFLGPTPEDVNIQFANFVGKAEFPPYWAFGFHLSRYGYNSLDNYQVVYDRMIAAQIPWDSQTFDIDYMDRQRDFTYDTVNFAGLPEFAETLHNNSMKLILMFDPALVIDFDNYPPSQRGKDYDVFIKWESADLIPDDQPEGTQDYIVGYVWPDNKTVFPDFFNPVTADWWANEIALFHKEIPFDGIWIDMNEPSNFGTNTEKPFNWPDDLPPWSLKCPNSTREDPPYATLAAFSNENECKRISDKTICMSTVQTDGINTYSHYDVHNIYGIKEIVATHTAMTTTINPGERPFILTRSAYPGAGHYAAHWTGDNSATWDQLKSSIIGIIDFNFYIIPMIGADVCGFFDEPSEELCIRWMQLGAFSPFDRNHNTEGTADQDPAKPGWEQCPVISKSVLELRYKYLPYFYARFHRAHMNGYSVIRPLFNVFPSDITTRDISDQFMWSSDLLVAPVVEEGAVSRDVYFPDSIWYDLVSGERKSEAAGTQLVDAPLDTIPVYLRGGSILPFQSPSLTTTESRNNGFGLTVALNSNGEASGEVYWDYGYEIRDMSETFIGEVNYSEGQLSLVGQYDPTIAEGVTVENIEIFGFPSEPTGIDVNGEAADSSSWEFDETTNVLKFTLSIPLNVDFSINFKTT